MDTILLPFQVRFLCPFLHSRLKHLLWEKLLALPSLLPQASHILQVYLTLSWYVLPLIIFQ